MSGNFKDHFASVAAQYSENRPSYPPALFDWLARLCPAHDLAWDCGAGSGQASLELARHFSRVLATDASAAQIGQAQPHARIAYRVAPAEESGLPDQACDLVVVAQALHWFDLERFYREVRRVLKPGGVVAAWSYGVLEVEGDEVNAVVQRFYHDEVGPWWPPERRHVESGYRELAFPFSRIAAPPFAMALSWNLPQLLGYFRSWSATAACLKARGRDPVADLEPQLRACWGDAKGERLVQWPLALLAGTP
ncbi:MAG: class I SAM-dependent methyltransferase [Rhodocyclaceae bacterium]|nr:class I SAM-dependent methyltransferase [Rhodocyclaceae bacterium]